MAEGSGHPLLTQSLLKSIEIDIPTERLIRSFDNSVKFLLKKIDSNSKQMTTLEKVRDTLLPKLMRGEARVKM